MPIYEYKCSECEAHFEKMQKVAEEKLTVCEKCGGKLEKQWSLSGFQFKGEGWYVTDYAKKNGKTSEKSEKSEKTEKSSGSDSTDTAKPASNEKSESASSEKKETVSKKE
jgi:putative FmdB family regulatory protein